MRKFCNFAGLVILGLIVEGRFQESFNTHPPPVRSNFTCSSRPQGFYADFDSECRVYHHCDDHGNRYTHRCPEGTAFRQDASICDHAHLVDCQIEFLEMSSQKIVNSNVQNSLADPRRDETRSRGFTKSSNSDGNSRDSKFSNYQPKFNDFSSLDRNGPSDKDNYNSERRTSSNKFISKSRNTVSNFNVASKHQTAPRPFKSSSDDSPNNLINQEIDRKNIDYSFLHPPPIRTDNIFLSSNFQNDKSTTTYRSHVEEDVQTVGEPDDRFFGPRIKNAVDSSTKSSNFLSDPKPLSILQPPKLTSATQTSKSSFNIRNDNYPYLETLRSIQNSQSAHDETLNFASSSHTFDYFNQENDPYYPRDPTTTEIYYTPREGNKFSKLFLTTTRSPLSSVKFQFPSILPDLNSLEDLVDRRKLFFIPRVKAG